LRTAYAFSSTASAVRSPGATGIKSRNSILSIFNEINGHFMNKFSKKEWEQLQGLLSKLDVSIFSGQNDTDY
jgi:hypothetical protein